MTPRQDTFNQQHDLTCCAGRALCVHIPALTCAAALLALTLPLPRAAPSQEQRIPGAGAITALWAQSSAS